MPDSRLIQPQQIEMAMSEHMFGTFGPLERKWAESPKSIRSFILCQGLL